MAPFVTPAINAFLARAGEVLTLGQVQISRKLSGFEISHVDDGQKPAADLQPAEEARRIAQSTADGRFRPLKASPNLRSGWRIFVPDIEGLEFVLNQLYPGAIADWYAVESGLARPTHYREFTGRQTGMYRITAHLSDDEAAAMITVCCGEAFCLKRRLWTVPGLAVDDEKRKDLIPCLEPCAVLLEFARQTARRLQAGRNGDHDDSAVDLAEPAPPAEAPVLAARERIGVSMDRSTKWMGQLRRDLFSPASRE